MRRIDEYDMEKFGTLDSSEKNDSEYDMDKFGTLDSSEKMIAILGNRWWRQAAKQKVRR